MLQDIQDRLNTALGRAEFAAERIEALLRRVAELKDELDAVKAWSDGEIEALTVENLCLRADNDRLAFELRVARR